MGTELRKIEVKREEEWVELESMQELVEGDTFRMFEPNGTPVIALRGGLTEFVAKSAPRESDIQAIWVVDVDDAHGWRCTYGTGEVYEEEDEAERE